jgi:hypothetical protein
MWVSDRSREIWEAKFVQFAECWRQIEWLTVVDGIRPCALLSVSQQEFAGLASVLREFGLKAVALLGRIQTEGRKKILLYRVAIGRARDLRVFRKAWKAGNDDTIGQLLGYPKCCRTFFNKIFVQDALIDCTWQMGCQTLGNSLEIQHIEVRGLSELNPFWIPVGIKMVPHFPCRFDCPEAYALAQRFIISGKKAGYETVLKTALEILNWPVEWSRLHGIAEIRTPILKISQRTDATTLKHTIRLLGKSYPKEGAKALQSMLHFSARMPTTITSSPRAVT